MTKKASTFSERLKNIALESKKFDFSKNINSSLRLAGRRAYRGAGLTTWGKFWRKGWYFQKRQNCSFLAKKLDFKNVQIYENVEHFRKVKIAIFWWKCWTFQKRTPKLLVLPNKLNFSKTSKLTKVLKFSKSSKLPFLAKKLKFWKDFQLIVT